MRISDWSSDVCSSDLQGRAFRPRRAVAAARVTTGIAETHRHDGDARLVVEDIAIKAEPLPQLVAAAVIPRDAGLVHLRARRSEERRVGTECVGTSRSRWSQSRKKNKYN